MRKKADTRFLAGIAALVAMLLVCITGAVSCPTHQIKTWKMEHAVTETDNNRTIAVHPGETVRIVLPENATTGYRWEIDRYDEELIRVVSTEPHYTAKAPGSGGEVDFTVQGKKTGTGEIMLKQWRSWEGDRSVISRFRLRLDIQP